MSLTLLGNTSQQEQIAHQLVESGYTGFTKGKGIKFSKGIKSPGVYGDCRKVLSNKILRSLVINRYQNFVLQRNESFSGIAAVETGGIGFAAILAERLGKSYLGVRKEPKGHGDQSWFAGDVDLFRDINTLVIEDMTTTAGSLLGAIKPLRELLNCKVTTALTVFSYGFPQMIKETDEAGVAVFTLCTFKQMLEAAVEERMIDTEYEVLIRSWLENPHDESWVTDKWIF